MSPGAAGSAQQDVSTTVCATYCDRATKVCTVTADGCRSGCKSELKGSCGAEFRILYECWANADALVCADFNVASAEACRSLSEDAGNCVLAQK